LLISAVVGQYCNSGPSSSSDTNIGPVTLVGENGSGIQDVSNCPKTIGPRDLTNLFAEITPGKSYTLQYNTTTCGYFYTSLVGAWIDYNKNTIFEPSESLFPFMRWNTAGQGKADFTVPTNLDVSGPTRLRVQLQETSNSTIDPCSYFSYGGTKDFTVNISKINVYCASGPTSQEDTHLGPAIILGAKNDIVQYANPCPGTLGPQNFTTLSADFEKSKTYPFSISVITCNKVYPNLQTTGWIDFNGDGVWSESERVLPATSHFGAIFFDVTIPDDAITGPVSARFMVQEVASNQTSIGPCDMFKYGGTHDYPLQIL